MSEQQYIIVRSYKSDFGARTILQGDVKYTSAREAQEQADTLNADYPVIHHWVERVPATKIGQEINMGIAPEFVGEIYRAFVMERMDQFENDCGDLTVAEMRLLAIRLQKMSTHIRSLIDARMQDIDVRR